MHTHIIRNDRMCDEKILRVLFRYWSPKCVLSSQKVERKWHLYAPKLFKEHTVLISSGVYLFVKGHVSSRNGEISLALDAIRWL